MSTRSALTIYDETKSLTAHPAVQPILHDTLLPVNFSQELPPLFASALTGFLREDTAPLLALFVPSDDVLGERVPAHALAVTAEGVVFMEEGEVILGNTPWGVKSLLYPYSQITAVGLGMALLTARFTLHGMGNAPVCEIALQHGDLPRFEAAARLISEQIAGGGCPSAV